MPIAVCIGLVGICNVRAVVSRVRHTVAVDIVVADIANAVCVRIGLIGVCVQRTVIGCVQRTIAVDVIVADIADAISVRVGLIGIRRGRAVVDAVGNPITVAVELAVRATVDIDRFARRGIGTQVQCVADTIVVSVQHIVVQQGNLGARGRAQDAADWIAQGDGQVLISLDQAVVENGYGKASADLAVRQV